MTATRFPHLPLTLGLLAALTTSSGAQAAPPVHLRLDGETVVGGVPAGCTGIGQTCHDPKWNAYAVRIEFADSKGEYLSDEVVGVSTAKGLPVLAVTCAGPWILLNLPPGTYAIEGSLLHSSAKPRKAMVLSPKHGQTKVGLQFPDI